jgi:hypothetical protein
MPQDGAKWELTNELRNFAAHVSRSGRRLLRFQNKTKAKLLFGTTKHEKERLKKTNRNVE